MKSSFLVLSPLFILTVAVLSAPIQDPDDRAIEPRDLGMVFAFYGVVSAVTVGVMALGTVIRGLVQNWTNRKLVNHVFEELRKYEIENAAGRTGVGIGYTAKTVGNETIWTEMTGSESVKDKGGERPSQVA